MVLARATSYAVVLLRGRPMRGWELTVLPRSNCLNKRAQEGHDGYCQYRSFGMDLLDRSRKGERRREGASSIGNRDRLMMGVLIYERFERAHR